MISDEFNIGHVDRANFGVCIKPEDAFRFVPTDPGVRLALSDILSETIREIEALPGDWEAYDISEDYGDPRKIRLNRGDPLATRLSTLYDMDGLEDLPDIMAHIRRVEFYFGHFWDNEGRKILGVCKSAQFKAALSASGRLLTWGDDTLKVVQGGVLRLDRQFDAIVTDTHVYMSRPRPVEQIAEIVQQVAATAREKIDQIQRQIPFIDFSYIRRDIDKHPRMARLAASIASRADLGDILQARLEAVCEQHAILLRPVNGVLRPKRLNENALLEVLDDRRYATQITNADPTPFRATGRQRVVRA